jgi:hypothetical protein
VQFAIDRLQRAWRFVDVEVVGEGYLITTLNPFAVDPSIRHIGEDLADKILVDVFTERHVFVIAQLRIGLGIAIRILADVGG